jgi:3-deoxy-D-manno-octulosonic-acid transferase
VRFLYSALFYLATPFILGRLAWRGRKLPAYRSRWGERFAVYAARPEPGVIWFHAVSVGEAEAAFPLIRAVHARFPATGILVTATTPTGSARIRAVLGDSVRHVYLPYDLPDCVDRFLRHFRPVLGVVLETEIWPNLYRRCYENRIPLAIVNGRLSERSARGYRRLRSLCAESLAALSLVAAQTSADAERYVELGADPARVAATGNIKFDVEFSEDMRMGAERIRGALFGTRPVWIAGSTHAGEDEQVLAAFAAVLPDVPDLLLILAPRHPERMDEVAALTAKLGFAVRRRSEGLPCDGSVRVFLLDSLGELRTFYAAADVAFVGGSLVPTGGHNVLEPAAAGIPVLFGPHMFNFAEVGGRLKASGGAIEVADAGDLAEQTRRLYADPAARARTGRRAKEFVAANRGALQRVVELLADLLPPARQSF